MRSGVTPFTLGVVTDRWDIGDDNYDNDDDDDEYDVDDDDQCDDACITFVRDEAARSGGGGGAAANADSM